jgi:acetyl esterase/lipase
MIIVDVDYRLAPEYPFPTQIWDSWAALKWVFANAATLGVDASRVSIGGLSAGGHLAAVLAQYVCRNWMHINLTLIRKQSRSRRAKPAAFEAANIGRPSC